MLRKAEQEELMKKIGFTSNSKFTHVNFLLWIVLTNNGQPVSKNRIRDQLKVDERTIYRYVSENTPFLEIKKGFVHLKLNQEK